MTIGKELSHVEDATLKDVKNFFSNSWSTNWYSNGTAGLYFLNIVSIECNALCGCTD